MSHNSYFNNILSYFQTMDIEKLRMYLKEEYTYQDTTKEIFLNEVASIFEAHQNSGDTEIVFYPGHCGASSDLCDNCGKKGYRMVGNNSGNYIDLIFEIKGEDILDIYDCSLFESEGEIKNLANQASIYIAKDDKITFKKTTEYWAKLNAANLAMSEIVTSPPSLVDYEYLCYWVDKNNFVNETIGGDPFFSPTMKWTPFLILFYDLNQMRSYLQDNTDLITKANFKATKLHSEEEIINWLLEYEMTYKNGPYELIYCMQEEHDYYVLKNKNIIHFKGYEYTNAISFLEFYKNKYYPLLDKYSTYSDEERMEAFNNRESKQSGIDITSLRFHLEKRKAMEEIGITIPLYIAKIAEPPF